MNLKLSMSLDHLIGKCKHGESQAGEGGEEDAAQRVEGDTLGVVQHGALVPLLI